MVIRYQDFAPQMLTPGGFLKVATFEPLQVAVDAANDWIKQNGIHVLNIETLLLPNIWSRFEEGTSDTSLGTSGDSPSQWHQVVRIWYADG